MYINNWHTKERNMKSWKLFIILISLTSIMSCEKSDPIETDNPAVEKYIQLLKANQYDSLNLPAFTYSDIPALLKYRNETQIITNFPHNPISSLFGPECKLGMYVLWTIESIRAVAINSEHLIMRFPSQNPILGLRDAQEYTLVFTEESHMVAAKAYYDWWYNHNSLSFSAFIHIDPLGESSYQWE
jgi:hypothetical protein